MRSVRIYKDDIRVHILRSLFFTDTVLAVSGALVIGGLLFLFFQYVLHYFHWPYYISSLIIGEICFVGIVTQKVDNQPIYQIVPRGITFKTSEKQYRQKDSEQYFVDFAIQDNLIIRKNAILITENTPMITRNYAVFSVACDTAKPHEKVKAIKKINDMGARFASAMVSCNISVRQLQNDELIQFSKDTLR